MADRRRKAKHSRDPLPIGAIRIRKRSRQASVRMIKVLWDREDMEQVNETTRSMNEHLIANDRSESL